MTLSSAIFRGRVVHERVRPKNHRFVYRVFATLLDLDELSDLDRRFRLFGYNRWAPLAFFDRDHGPANGAPLRPWVEDQLTQAGLPCGGGPIRLLCYPRIFGYVFNPLSVYFCYDREHRLSAIIHEVCNTYMERHSYVMPVAPNEQRVVRQSCDKSLYVSPFIAMEARYRFRITPPGSRVGLLIRQSDRDGFLLTAAFNGKREDLSDRSLARCLIRYPLLTLKVMAGIHWEALWLWLKGAPVFAHKSAGAATKGGLGQLDNKKV